MSMTYNYTKDKVSISRLIQEVHDSTITVALDYINVVGTELAITFKAELTTDEKTALDTLVANHSGEPMPDDPKEVKAILGSIVTPTSPQNDNCLQPFGAVKLSFLSNSQNCSITLSNKSQDGLTFSYNADCPIVPSIGNYIFQNDCNNRSWIETVDNVNHTITVELPLLEEGAGLYTMGHYIDCVIKDWATLMYLWGVMVKINNSGDNDFIELSIVDLYDLFKNPDVLQAMFPGLTQDQINTQLELMAFEINGEYEDHWTKYYDESWISTINSRQIMTPDGAPGECLPNLVARVSYFCTKTDDSKVNVYLDYIFTSKDEKIIQE